MSGKVIFAPPADRESSLVFVGLAVRFRAAIHETVSTCRPVAAQLEGSSRFLTNKCRPMKLPTLFARLSPVLPLCGCVAVHLAFVFVVASSLGSVCAVSHKACVVSVFLADEKCRSFSCPFR